MSASISAELPHYQAGVVNGTAGGFSTNGVTNTALGTAGQNMPDIVRQLRIDQNWGYLGVSGAVHQVAGRYYNAIGPFTANNSAHPDENMGGPRRSAECSTCLGDTIGATFAGTQGAIGYVTKAGSWQILNGSSAGVGWVADGML